MGFGLFDFEKTLKKKGLWNPLDSYMMTPEEKAKQPKPDWVPPDSDEWDKNMWGEERDPWKDSLWADEEGNDPWDEEQAYPESKVRFPIRTENTVQKIAYFIVGFVFAGVSIPCSLVMLFLHRTDLLGGYLIYTFLVLIVIGILLLLLFYRHYKTIQCFYRCVNHIGERIDIPIDELAREEGLSEEEMTRQLDRFIDLNFFAEGRIDRKRNHLYLTLEGFKNRSQT